MDLEERLALIRQVGEEIVTEDELRQLLQDKPHPVAYDGFEPSGTIHIAQGLLRAINVNKMTAAGVRFKMFVADWHAWANNKMGGDLDKIQTTGRYIQEIWKSTGMDLQHVEFVWASDLIQKEAYWKKVMNIARDSSLDRVLRTTQIMGRSDKDKLSAAQILYPCMQAADIFELGAHITQLGMDQRKVNMLAREVGPKLGFWKPVVVSHHMLMGLQQPPAIPKELSAQALRARFLDVADKLRRIDFIGPTSAVFDATGRKRAQSNLDRILHLPEGFVGRDTAFETALKDYFRTAERNTPSIADGLVPTTLDAEVTDRLPESNNSLTLDGAIALYAELRAKFNLSRHELSAELLTLLRLENRLVDLALDELTRAWNEFVSTRESFAVQRATAMKMSKSNPDTAIFMTDTPEQVVKKLNKAYCPEKVVDENPVLEYARHIVFERAPKGEVVVERPEKFGGTVVYAGYDALAADFAAGKLHPGDLKKTVAKSINDLLQPTRDHFEKDPKARALKEQVESFKVTR